MANNKRTATSTSSKEQPQGDSRAAKRAQFSGDQKRSPLVWAVPVVIIAIAVLASVALIVTRGGGGTVAQASATPSSDVTIPVAQVNDGAVHFFASRVDGTEVKYFVVKASDGSLRTAFDACDVCFPQKKGYSAIDGAVKCNNCGRTFPLDQVSVQQGGCNPSPITAKKAGGNLVIPYSQLQSGVRFF